MYKCVEKKLDPQGFGFLDLASDPQKYADPWIRIQGATYQQKTAKICSLSTPQI